MCGGAHAGSGAVFPGEHLFDSIGWQLAQPDMHEGSHDATAHFVQESLAFDDERERSPAFSYIATSQGPDSGTRRITGIRGEGFEIVFADEERSSAPHGGQVERTRDVPGAVANHRIHGGV